MSELGDPRRNEVFAKFIVRTFPKAKSILCVADGKGELAELLAGYGKRVRVIEQSPRFTGRARKSLRYEKGTFSRDSKVTEDVIVGMHPDEATEAIIIAAKRNNCGYAVVPCCHLTEHGGKACVASPEGWRNHLMSLWSGALSTKLRGMTGRNIVLWRKP